METPPPKRRKTSIDGLTPERTINAEELSVNQDGALTTPSRPLFMSPTKASLAKFNPNLLPRTKSPAREVVRSRSANRNSFGQNRAATTSNAVNEGGLMADGAEGRRKSHLIGSLIREGRNSPAPVSSTTGGALSALPRRRSRTPGRLSPTKANKPTAPAAPAAEEHVANSAEEVESGSQSLVQMQVLDGATSVAQSQPAFTTPTRSGRRIASRKLEEEPELPPTPTELGLEPPPEPPKGLFSSSPSRKRAKKRRGAGLKPSPLKLRDSPPDRRDEDALMQEVDDASVQVEDSQKVQEAAPDPELVKKQEKEKQLQLQVKGLQGDIEVLRAELNRAGGSNATNRSREEVDKLISVLISNNPTHKPLPPAPKPPPLSSRLAAFLPFARPRPPTAPSSILDTTPRSPKISPLDDADLQSKAFSVFAVDSRDTLLPTSTSDDPLFRSQEITMTSPHELIIATFKLLVNTRTDSVDSLTLTSLSSSAESELGPWVREQAINGDINSIGWALGRYWEVASIRARCWKSCEEEYPDLVPFAKDSSSTQPSIKKTAPVKRVLDERGKSVASTAAHRPIDSEAGAERIMHLTPTATPLSRSDLGLYLPLSSLTLSLSEISLHITWRITFDWLGDVESHVSAQASFPLAWKSADERGSLGNVGEVFDRLVRKRGIREAVRIVVGVIFGDGREGE